MYKWESRGCSIVSFAIFLRFLSTPALLSSTQFVLSRIVRLFFVFFIFHQFAWRRSSLLSRETIASRVQEPRIVVRALRAGEETKSLSRKLPGRQGTSIRKGTVRLTLLVAGFFPLLEVPEVVDIRGRLHPFDDLNHRGEVNIRASKHLLDELDELVLVLLLALQPRSVEMKT